jgi:hypothetical protein
MTFDPQVRSCWRGSSHGCQEDGADAAVQLFTDGGIGALVQTESRNQHSERVRFPPGCRRVRLAQSESLEDVQDEQDEAGDHHRDHDGPEAADAVREEEKHLLTIKDASACGQD